MSDKSNGNTARVTFTAELLAGQAKQLEERAQACGLSAGQYISNKLREVLFEESAKGTVPNAYLSPGNLDRLTAVAAALECDPVALLNNFLAEELVTPSTIADGMDFTEGGRLAVEDADTAERRVMAAAVALDADGWKPDYLIP